MLAIIKSSTIIGIKAYPITVEVDVSNGMPGFCIVGLPDSVVKESRDRVFAALRNSGYTIPCKRMIVSLAPADIRKAGAAFDLPIALGLLLASSQASSLPLDNVHIIGELSLEGVIKPVRGLLSIAFFLNKLKGAGIIFPKDNEEEVSVFSELPRHCVSNLEEAVEALVTPFKKPKPAPLVRFKEVESEFLPDFVDVKGQEQAKRALEIAAAGSHNFLLIGSPGCGKSLLAQRLPSILPAMSREESLTTTMIYSAAGQLPEVGGLIKFRPFRSPHHIISNAALIGGGTYPKPGEVSLAHNGVLFLDELPEFPKAVLESLRQPIEDGKVTIARAAVTLSYPSQIMLGAAMNPCPCGYYLDPKRDCVCSPIEVKKYMAKISGPLLDRIDIQLEMPVLSYAELANRPSGESSNTIRNRVEMARDIQLNRFSVYPNVFCNGQMGPKEILKFCSLHAGATQLLKNVVEKLGLSARAYDRILRMARTIADIECSQNIEEVHLAEAIHYRSMDRMEQYVG